MEDLKVRQSIPDSWAVNAHCILCGFTPLTVEHKQPDPDQIKCPRCGLSIVLDVSGQYACVSCLPQALQGSPTTTWMKVPDLVNYLKLAYTRKTTAQPAPSSPFKNFKAEDIDTLPIEDIPLELTDQKEGEQPVPIPPAPFSGVISDELAFKTKALHDLGNPSWKIKQILSDTGKYNDEEITATILTVEAEEKKKANRSALKIAGIAVGVVIILGLLWGAITVATSIFSPNLQDANDMIHSASTKASNVRTENPPIAPAQVLTFVPPGFKLIDVPTPLVVQYPTSPVGVNFQSKGTPSGTSNSNPSARSNCPLSSKDAAALYGGTEKSWTRQQDQWVFIDKNGATITLPQGMSAGYLVVSSGMEIKSVLGPAQISNIYMIMISCN